MQALRGKVVLVTFWATSCATCVKEMPAITATHERYRSRGYETLAGSMSYDPPVSVVNLAESRRLPFAVAIDNTGAADTTTTSLGITRRGNDDVPPSP